jgi:hypothetical protein
MVKKRTNIPTSLKEQLRKEAGNKCANPGCNILRTHIHHIKHWAIYSTHDDKHMIAVCPNCHDAIHHGKISLKDETIYKWKQIDCPTNIIRDHLYTTPNITSKVLLGSIAVQAPEGVIIFRLSPNNQLSFQILGKDILLLNLNLSKLSSDEILRVEQNYITHQKDPSVEYKQIPGQIQILVPNNSEYIQDWAKEAVRRYEPEFGTNKQIPIIHIEVIKAGVVRVQGIWIDNGEGIIATLSGLYFVSSDEVSPPKSIAFVGNGENSGFYTRIIDKSLFGGAASVLKMPHFQD